MNLTWSQYLKGPLPNAKEIEDAINRSLQWMQSYTENLPDKVSVTIQPDDEGTVMEIDWEVVTSITKE